MTEFTSDWFTRNIEQWKKYADALGRVDHILEVGSFEGRSTCWLLEHLLSDNGVMTCIDTWSGSPEHLDMKIDMSEVFKRFQSNVREVIKINQSVQVMQMESSKALSHQLLNKQNSIDFIYIDGNHWSHYVLTDACISFWLIKEGGIIVFDDYHWDLFNSETKRPKTAIDSFLRCFAEHLDVIHHGYQVVVQKKIPAVRPGQPHQARSVAKKF